MLTIFKVYFLDYFQVCLRHLLHAQRGTFLTWIQSKYNGLCQGNHQKSIKYTSIIIPAIVCQKRIY